MKRAKYRLNTTPLNDLPTVVTGPGLYRCRDGSKVTIIRVAPPLPECTAFAAKGSVWRMFRGRLRPRGYQIWHISGRLYSVYETAKDIVGPWVEGEA